MKVTDGGDIPRMAGEGARQEGADVVNEEVDDCVHKFLRMPGDW